MINLAPKQVFGKIPMRKKLNGGQKGNAWSWPIYEDLVPATDTLTEGSDVTPQTVADTSVTVTLYEYGAAAVQTAFLKATAYTDAHRACAKLIAKQYAASTELLIRNVAGGGSYVYTPSNVARTSLVVATYPFTYAHLSALQAQLLSIGMPTQDDGNYLVIMHPAMQSAIMQDSTMWEPLAYYNKGNTEAGNVFAGEIGRMLGFRFVVSPWGKIYYGGGGAAHATNIATTTTTTAITAGATSLILTSATNAAVGDIITVGALETANTESVMVTSVASTPTLSIRGVGNVTGNTGFKFAHDAGVAVYETQHIGAFHILGKDSIGYLYSSETGPTGRIESHNPDTYIADRFTSTSWWQLGGWARIAEQYIWRAEFPVPSPFIGYTEAKP